jgi:environmental stress-induced protein Ves
MPWKNGGGTTTELHVSHVTPERFGWRASIATVAADGPFSLFPGCDRHILCIEGRGFILEGGPFGDLVVGADFQPRSFSGDWQIMGRLIDGASRDFNLIADRQRFGSSLDCLDFDGDHEIAASEAHGLVFVHQGACRFDASQLSPYDALVLEPGDSVRLTGAARIVLARVWCLPTA